MRQAGKKGAEPIFNGAEPMREGMWWLRQTVQVVLATVLLASAGPVAAATSDRPERVALVIGNSAYKPPGSLRNPVNDARDVADKLEALGFEVIRGTDLGLRDMARTITRFGNRIRPGGVALFFYAGHGIQANGRNFLVPVDAEISSESSVRSESIDVDQVLGQLAPAAMSIVILDACRNNPFERSFRSGSGAGLAQIDAPKGTLIAYSTAPGRVAEDGAGRNSPYTAQLLRHVDESGRRVEDLFKQIRIGVARATGDRQIPWESSSLTGDFYFRQAAIAAAAPPAPSAPNAHPKPDLVSMEPQFWESIKASRDAGDYEAYLEQYPKGIFAPLARARLKTLHGPSSPAAGQAAPNVDSGGSLGSSTQAAGPSPGSGAATLTNGAQAPPEEQPVALATARQEKRWEGPWKGRYVCGPHLGPGATLGASTGFVDSVEMVVTGSDARLQRLNAYLQETLSAKVAEDGSFHAEGEGRLRSNTNTAWTARFDGRPRAGSNSSILEARGAQHANNGEKTRDCTITFVRR